MGPQDFDREQTRVLRSIQGLSIKGLENFDLGKLMFNVTGEALKASKPESFKRLIRTIVFDVISLQYIKGGADVPLIITYDYHRIDHTSYWNRFKDIVGDCDEIIIEEGKQNYKRIRTPKEIVSVLINYRSARKMLSGIGNSSFCRVIAANVSELIEFRKKLDCLKIDSHAALIFFDGNHVENLIVQELRNRGVTVAAMQHGQPVFHGMDCDRINQTMILNFSSDYIMVTGEFSKKQFMKGGVSEDKIFVGGSLRKICSIKESDNNSFAVFLDCPTNPNAVRDNEELLRCAAQLGCLLNANYVIKTHPQDDPDNYKSFSDTRGAFVPKGSSVNDALENAAFALLHASGVYLDIISYGVKAFCYVNETVFPLVEEGLDSFSSAEELEIKIRTWNAYDADSKREYMQKIIDYYLYPDGVEERYKNFVKKLNEIQRDRARTDGKQV